MAKKRNIILGVTGGIAAYKACELTRLFVKDENYSVNVIMTKNATEFVSPLTFSTLSQNPVSTDMFENRDTEKIQHIDLADEADLVVVAPATANIIGKVSGGIADDLLSTVIMATKAPVLFCPAMNVNMYENPIVRQNIEKLKTLGYLFVDPAEGLLACGWEGKGRMADPSDIYSVASDILSEKDLSGMRVLVTAGPTREMIDPVRYISNRSSGKMGYAIAERAKRRGAEVILVSGPTHLKPPTNVETINIVSAEDMAESVKSHFNAADVVIKAAAVLDFAPKDPSAQKIKKNNSKDIIELKRTEDILKGLGKAKGKKILVGFAAETQDLVKNARKKLEEKNLDMIVANDVSKSGSGFETDTNKVRIIDANGDETSLPLLSKEEVADKILDRVKDIWESQKEKGR